MKKFFILAISSFILFTACQTMTTPSQPSQKLDSSYTVSESGLQMKEVLVGEGQEAKAGDEVSVHYTGTLQDGTKFDSSVDRGVPFEFTLGMGEVIAGWDEGVAGMKVGGKRILVIPSNLAYGDQAMGPIPAGSTLVFEVELLEVL